MLGLWADRGLNILDTLALHALKLKGVCCGEDVAINALTECDLGVLCNFSQCIALTWKWIKEE